MRACKVKLVRVHRAFYHCFPEAVGRSDKNNLVKAGLGIQREHDARRPDIAAHHLLHTHRQRNPGMSKTFMHPVGDGAVVVQ